MVAVPNLLLPRCIQSDFGKRGEQWGRHFLTNEGFKTILLAHQFLRPRGGGGVRLIRLGQKLCSRMVWEELVDLPTWDLSKGRFLRRSMISNRLNQSPINQQIAWTIWAIKKTSKTIQHTGCFKDLYQAIRMNSIMTSTKNSQPFSEATLLFWSFLYSPENEQPPALQRKKPSELSTF